MKLKRSLISSYRPAGIGVPAFMPGFLRAYAEDPVDAEFYVAMERDVQSWALHWNWLETGDPTAATRQPDPRVISGIEFLARLTPKELAEYAETAKDQFATVTSRHVAIIALASFIPEVTSFQAGVPVGNQNKQGQQACSAIANLIRMASRMGDDEHQVATVELVAGSRIQTVSFRGEDFFIHLMSDEEGRRNVLACIAEALERVAGEMPELRVRIALELEPGPLFLLRDWPTVQAFSEEIRGHSCELVRRLVGLNLDIAHWRLAQIKPADVEANKEVKRLIYHAHIAGHHRAGHFGDIALFDLNNAADFEPWLKLLDSLVADQSAFDGYVSVELEAADDEVVVLRSLHDLAQML